MAYVRKKKRGQYNYVSLFNDLSTKKITQANANIVIKDLKSRYKYLDRFALVYIYSAIGNHYRAQKELAYLIDIPGEALSVAIDIALTSEQRNNFSNEFFKVLEKIKVIFEDKKLFDIYLENLISLNSDKLKKIILRYRGDLFYTKISFNSSDYKYSFNYPSFWYRKLSAEERVGYVKSFYRLPIKKKASLHQYGIFRSYFPSNKDQRSLSVSKVKNNLNNLELWQSVGVLDALENPVVKKYLSLNIESFKKPLFTIKRNMILDQIEKGHVGRLGVLNLISLGLNNSEFVWWFYE